MGGEFERERERREQRKGKRKRKGEGREANRAGLVDRLTNQVGRHGLAAIEGRQQPGWRRRGSREEEGVVGGGFDCEGGGEGGGDGSWQW